MAVNKKPLLPLRDIVIFPSMVVPLFVGRERSIKALQEVMKNDKLYGDQAFPRFPWISIFSLIFIDF